MTTVGELRAAISQLPSTMPVILKDTRSGVVEELSFGKDVMVEGR